MSDPDALRSIFEDHSDLEMDNLAKPNPILKLKLSIQSIRSLQATRHQQCVTSECTALLGRRSDLGGYRTVASAHALRQPTSCGSEYFYNQRPRVPNLIGS